MSTYSGDFRTRVVNAVLNEGMPIKQAVRTFNLSRDTVRRWVRIAQGIIVPANNTQKISKDIKREAVSKVLAGDSYYKVAKEYGVSHSSIHYWIGELEKESLKTEIEELKAEIKNLQKRLRG